jgi:hypothetical protein
MGALCYSKVFRGGVSQKYLDEEERTSDIHISAPDTLRIEFSIPSKGGGFTKIILSIGPGDFKNLAKYMSASHRATAMRAMSGELKRLRKMRRRHEPGV